MTHVPTLRSIDEILTKHVAGGDVQVVAITLELRSRLAAEEKEARELAKLTNALIHAVLPGIAVGLLTYASAAFYRFYVGGPDVAAMLGVAAGFIAAVALGPGFEAPLEHHDGNPAPPAKPVGEGADGPTSAPGAPFG